METSEASGDKVEEVDEKPKASSHACVVAMPTKCYVQHLGPKKILHGTVW